MGEIVGAETGCWRERIEGRRGLNNSLAFSVKVQPWLKQQKNVSINFQISHCQHSGALVQLLILSVIDNCKCLFVVVVLIISHCFLTALPGLKYADKFKKKK